MKPNKLTKGSNILWESSRIILPEHRDMILRHQKESQRLVKPILDDQKLMEIERMLQHSVAEGVELEMKLFGEYEYEVVSGIVSRLDQKFVELKYGEERKRVPFERIIEVSYF